jgi:hypothetical protein
MKVNDLLKIGRNVFGRCAYSSGVHFPTVIFSMKF